MTDKAGSDSSKPERPATFGQVNVSQIIETLDGSPTLEFIDDSGYIEAMHNRKGAFAETVYIYDAATEWILAKDRNFSAFSMGLGIGYIEFILVAHLLKANSFDKLTSLVSTESESTLTESMADGLRTGFGGNSTLDKARKIVIGMAAQHFGIEPNNLVDALSELLQSARWRIEGAHYINKNYLENFGIIYYDAYSKKMDPKLWDPEELTRFLSVHKGDPCVFVSYAATGDLNRALKKTGFKITKKRGFGGKRESTQAVYP